jgi:hypothetical protein
MWFFVNPGGGFGARNPNSNPRPKPTPAQQQMVQDHMAMSPEERNLRQSGDGDYAADLAKAWTAKFPWPSERP